MIRRAALFDFVRGFVCFSLLESEEISEWAGDSPPEGSNPSRDRDEGCTEEDNERGREDAGPQSSDEWVPEVEEVGTHHLGIPSVDSQLVGVGEGVVDVARRGAAANNPKIPLVFLTRRRRSDIGCIN